MIEQLRTQPAGERVAIAKPIWLTSTSAATTTPPCVGVMVIRAASSPIRDCPRNGVFGLTR